MEETPTYPSCEMERQDELATQLSQEALDSLDRMPVECPEQDCVDINNRRQSTEVALSDDGFAQILKGFCRRYKVRHTEPNRPIDIKEDL